MDISVARPVAIVVDKSGRNVRSSATVLFSDKRLAILLVHVSYTTQKVSKTE